MSDDPEQTDDDRREPRPQDQDSEHQRTPEPGAGEGVDAPLAGEELPGGAQR